MRLHSTPRSVLGREVSALAITECVFSVAVYVGAALLLNSLFHIAIAIACAPLLLLRTRYSVHLGLAWWKKAFAWTDRFQSDWALVIVVPLLLFYAVVIRFTATAAGLFRHPKLTISSIPSNWVRQAICTDFYSSPEIIPGESRRKFPSLTFSETIEAIKDAPQELKRNFKEGLFLSIVAPVVLILGYLPSVIIRISFKATSFAYLPLLWAAKSAGIRRGTLDWRLDRVTKGELEKTRRKLSAFILLAAICKMALLMGLVSRDYFEKKLDIGDVADSLIIGWPWWQISLIADAATTYAMFYYADWLGSSPVRRVPAQEGVHIAAFSLLSFLRTVSAVLVVGYFFLTAVWRVSEGANVFTL